MPKASTDDHAGACKDYVWAVGQLPLMQPVAKSLPVQEPAVGGVVIVDQTLGNKMLHDVATRKLIACKQAVDGRPCGRVTPCPSGPVANIYDWNVIVRFM